MTSYKSVVKARVFLRVSSIALFTRAEATVFLSMLLINIIWASEKVLSAIVRSFSLYRVRRREEGREGKTG